MSMIIDFITSFKMLNVNDLQLIKSQVSSQRQSRIYEAKQIKQIDPLQIVQDNQYLSRTGKYKSINNDIDYAEQSRQKFFQTMHGIKYKTQNIDFSKIDNQPQYSYQKSMKQSNSLYNSVNSIIITEEVIQFNKLVRDFQMQQLRIQYGIKHIQQLSPIIIKNKDILSKIEYIQDVLVRQRISQSKPPKQQQQQVKLLFGNGIQLIEGNRIYDINPQDVQIENQLIKLIVRQDDKNYQYVLEYNNPDINNFDHFKIHHQENEFQEYKQWIKCPFKSNNFKYNDQVQTIQQLIYNITFQYPTRKCLGQRSYIYNEKLNKFQRGYYQFYTYSDLLILASDLAKSLTNQLKLKKGDKVGILSRNRPEWSIVELACASQGIILVGLYDTQSKGDLLHTINLTKINCCFTEMSTIQKYIEVFSDTKIQLILFDDDLYSRLVLIKNQDKLKFALPKYTRSTMKPHKWFQNINQIYINEKSENNTNTLCCKLNEEKMFYFYEPQINANIDQLYEQFYPHKYLTDINILSNFQTSFCCLLESQLQDYQNDKKIKPMFGHISVYQLLQQELIYNPHLVDKDDICTYVMTSGTSGRPKAVCLTYCNLYSTAATMNPMCLALGQTKQQDYMMSFLPLSHVYQRVLSLVAYIQIAAQCFISGSIKQLVDDFQYAGPTALICVPKVVQKVYSGVLQKLKDKSDFQRAFFNLCYQSRLKIYKQCGIYNKFRTGQREILQEDLQELFFNINNEKFDVLKAIQGIPVEKQKEYTKIWYYRPLIQPRYENIFLLNKANVDCPKYTNIVFNAFQKHIGGRMRGAVSGSACVTQSEADFFRMCFHAAFFQGYGTTETAAAGTVQNFASADSSGVGMALTKYCQIYLINSDIYKITDKPFPRGEIIIYGDSVFEQYLNEDEDSIQKRKNLMKQLNLPNIMDGRKMNIFSTADIGQFNIITGELEIIDRQSCNVKLSQGEYIQLTRIEEVINRYELVENTYVYAKSNQDFCIAVVEIINGRKYDRQQRLQIQNSTQKLSEHCKKYNLYGFQIPKYYICSFFQWNICENQLLTPSLKIKRCNCQKMFGELCESVYEQIKSNGKINNETINKIIDFKA